MSDLEHRAGDGAAKKERRPPTLQLVVGGVLALALLLFVFQNTQTVELNFLTFTFETKQWVFVVLVAAITVGITKAGEHVYRRRQAKARKRKAGADQRR